MPLGSSLHLAALQKEHTVQYKMQNLETFLLNYPLHYGISLPCDPYHHTLKKLKMSIPPVGEVIMFFNHAYNLQN